MKIMSNIHAFRLVHTNPGIAKGSIFGPTLFIISSPTFSIPTFPNSVPRLMAQLFTPIFLHQTYRTFYNNVRQVRSSKIGNISIVNWGMKWPVNFKASKMKLFFFKILHKELTELLSKLHIFGNYIYINHELYWEQSVFIQIKNEFSKI